jgi:hypothetical protein
VILCSFEGIVHLASNYIGGPDCSICVPPIATGVAGYDYRADRMGNWLKRPGMCGVTFYPELLWRGMRVVPICWKRDSKDPILLCLGRASEDAFGTEAIPADTPRNAEAVTAMLRASGWDAVVNNDPRKWIHVDELEKIEGPPPDGSF